MPHINSRFFFIVTAVGSAIGIGNVFIYPYFSANFSGIFFITYFIALVLLGVPLLMLEFSVGQYSNKNIVDLYASVKKWFSSIGWLMVINSFILMCIYAVALAWHVVYFFVSFGLQWKSNPKIYFFDNVLQISEGFSGFTKFSLPVFIALMVALLIVFFFIKKGFEGIKKRYLVIVTIFIILMLLFFFYSLTLDNALDNIYSFLKPKFTDLLGIDLWLASFSMAVVSLGISFGIMSAIARKSEKGFVVANSFIVVIFELLSAIAFSFILISVIGLLGSKQDIVFSDYGTLFITLTEALPLFYKPTLLSVLFLMFLMILFILGTASLAYSVAHVLVHKFNAKKIHAAILVCGFGFISGLLFVIKPGYYIMDIVLHFIYYNILIALLLEVIAIGWFFNSEKISFNINQFSKIKIGVIWRFIIRYIVPLILLGLIVFQAKSDLIRNYNNYPLWALLVFGVGTVAVPIIIAFLLPQKILDRK